MIFLSFVKMFAGFKLFFLDKHVSHISNELFDLTLKNILVTTRSYQPLTTVISFFRPRQSFGKFIHAEKFDKL